MRRRRRQSERARVCHWRMTNAGCAVERGRWAGRPSRNREGICVLSGQVPQVSQGGQSLRSTGPSFSAPTAPSSLFALRICAKSPPVEAPRGYKGGSCVPYASPTIISPHCSRKHLVCNPTFSGLEAGNQIPAALLFLFLSLPYINASSACEARLQHFEHNTNQLLNQLHSFPPQ